ncbi:hypothetical protein V6Z11_A11G212100 [Gossypium hirsutum]
MKIVSWNIKGLVGRLGGLITIWDKSSFIMKKEYRSNRFIVLEGIWCVEGWEGVLINVYAPNLLSEQKIFWEEILEVRERSIKFWVLGGDFNAIRNKSERSNCVGLLRGSKDFLNFIKKCNLVDLPLLGRKFTWHDPDNKKSQLDRFLVDEVWLEKIEDFQQQGLNLSVSDHIPILLSHGSTDWGPRPFKFFNAWVKNKEYMSIIRNEWGSMGYLNGKVSEKLKKPKGVLRKWNREERYTLDRRFNEIEARIRCLDECSDVRDLFELELEELKILYLELGVFSRFKESIWRQKSRMTWLMVGDSNTTFFQRAVKFKAKRKTIYGMKIGNEWLSDPKALKLSLEEVELDLELNFKRLRDIDIASLEKPFSMKEIKEVVWSCDENKAPGPDGFNLCFFLKCWEVVKEDLFEMMVKFFNSGKLEKSINSSFIALIPKNDNPQDISEFRPICLVSSLYKIVAKVLARRVRVVIVEVVSDS